MSEDKIPIYISKTLYEKIRERVEQSQGEFNSVEDYIEFVLNEVVREEKEEKEVYTPEEEEEIKRRLRSLGYL